MLETSSNLRIVLVQENENDRLLFRRAFQKSDVSCEIIECSRAEEALEQLSADAQSFDVVAVDHNLPGISGMDLCRKLLDNKIPPPLVLLAEIGSEQLVAEALKAGVHDYIIKDQEQGYLDLLPISLINIARRHFDRMVDKRTESRLSESEQTFKTIFDNAADGILLADVETKKFYMGNHIICQLLGYDLQELTALSIMDIHPEQDVPHVMEQFEKQARGEISLTKDIPVRKKDGSVFYADVNAFSIIVDGKAYLMGIFRDVSERKQVENTLRESEARYRTLVEQIPAITYRASLDKASTTLYISPQIKDLIGFTAEEYKSDPDIWRKRLHPNDRDRVLRFVSRSHAEKKPFVSEYRMIAKNSSVVWFRDEAVIVKDEKNQPLFLQGVMYDITERKQADDEIRKFKTISDKAGHGVAISDLHGNLVYVNDSFAQMHQYCVDELIGKNLSIFHNEEQLDHVNQLNDQLTQQGSYVAGEVWHKKRDNTVFPTLMSATLVSDESGEPLFMASTAIDITKHKKAEEALQESELRYRTLFEILPVGVGLSTPDGRIIDANSTFQQMLGYSTEDMRRINVFDTYHNPAERTPHLKQLQQDGFVRGFEVQLKRKDGTIFLASLNVTTMRIRDETVFVTTAKDITEHKRLERALAESEEKYRMLIECARDAIYTLDENGVFLFANKMGAENLGYQSEDLVGKTLRDVFPKEIAERQAANIRKVIETGQGINSISLTEIQNKPRWYSATIEPLKNDHGKVTTAMIIARDIDDMKRAEEQIQKLSSAVEQSIDGVAISDMDTRLVYVNDSYARMHGYSPEEMGGMKVADLYPNKSGDYIRTINQRNTQGSFTGEVEHIRKNGTIVPAYLSVTLLKNDKDEVVGSIAICRDMTEYKHTQKMLEIKNAALESSINGIVLCNVEGNLTYVNNAFLKIWDYEDQSEVLGRNATQFWKVSDKEEEIKSALQSGEGWIGELTAVRKDGSLFDIQICQTSIRDENGMIISLMASFVDITEEKRREEELSKYRGQMARAEQLASLGTLSATIAHQLTQPLTVIRLSMDNALDELEATSSSETVIRRLKGSVAQVSNITSIIGNFRNFARKSSGKTVAEVNLKAVAVRIAMLLSESARSANIVLRIKDMGELPYPWMNETDLEQLFFALIQWKKASFS